VRMTGGRLDGLVHATHPGWITEINRLTVIGRRNKLRVLDLADWGFDRSSRGFRLKLGKPWLFWHHNREPYKTASNRLKTLVKSCPKSAQKREQHFRAFWFHDLRHGHAIDWRNRVDLSMAYSSVRDTYLAYLTAEEQRTANSGLEQKPEREQRFSK
jgi:integrase/recombinase XerD